MAGGGFKLSSLPAEARFSENSALAFGRGYSLTAKKEMIKCPALRFSCCVFEYESRAGPSRARHATH
eukprot:IDg12358t1